MTINSSDENKKKNSYKKKELGQLLDRGEKKEKKKKIKKIKGRSKNKSKLKTIEKLHI